MNNEVEENQNKSFPWKALAVFMAVVIAVGMLEIVTNLSSVAEGEVSLFIIGGLIGSVIAALLALIVVAVQYVFTKFPTQWISKQKHVYKYDIWSAAFYSTAIGTVINLLVEELGYGENGILSSVISIITTALFLFFYFSGEEKEANVKRAITIVQIAWLVIGIVLTMLVGNIDPNLGM